MDYIGERVRNDMWIESKAWCTRGTKHLLLLELDKVDYIGERVKDRIWNKLTAQCIHETDILMGDCLMGEVKLKK